MKKEEAVMYQICRICNLRKPLREFHRGKASKLGKRTICKQCQIIESARYYKAHKKEMKKYREEHPEEMKAKSYEQNRKGGSRYEKALKAKQTGIPGAKNLIRNMHSRRWRDFKRIIAPGSQIHHQWELGTAEYAGVALVETNQHQHGIIDVIKILDGKITLLTEKEIREQNQNNQPPGQSNQSSSPAWGSSG